MCYVVVRKLVRSPVARFTATLGGPAGSQRGTVIYHGFCDYGCPQYRLSLDSNIEGAENRGQLGEKKHKFFRGLLVEPYLTGTTNIMGYVGGLSFRPHGVLPRAPCVLP